MIELYAFRFIFC